MDVILDATARVLVRDGYAALTTNAVAAVAGVSIGSLYQYFPNKDALVLALRDRHSRRMHALIMAEVAHWETAGHDATLADLMGRTLHAAIEAHRLEPALHKVLALEAAHLETHHEEDETDGFLRALLERHAQGPNPEVTVPDLGIATFIVGRMAHALIHAVVLDPPPGADAHALEREAVRAVMAYLTA
ncbi:TetR/AcrR family transcriptional regulator [Nitrospirillum sp. BR 11164]|uniref:TetR/AcrR family transcriptional regulator n=1 Tax=Nitrospirillum sp. BR 11164 TaxID=3104324 RepID=UPI002B001F74|nr:TetR/AcrR family transcriptional regulator [Nitrospirillum sp. BR 11164]MEA1652269.1 TetR/AcrR family transcriptional regulator [Nitrospirillum sp. BR 11164]